eukprot:g46885.t1
MTFNSSSVTFASMSIRVLSHSTDSFAQPERSPSTWTPPSGLLPAVNLFTENSRCDIVLSYLHSSDALSQFQNFQFVGSIHFLFTMDMQSLYTSVSHKDSLGALCFFMVKDVALGTRSYASFFVGYVEHSLFLSYSGPRPQTFSGSKVICDWIICFRCYFRDKSRPDHTLVQCARSSTWQGTTETIEEEADEEVAKDIITPQFYHPPSYNAVANSYEYLDLSEENVSVESDKEVSKMDYQPPLSCSWVFHDVELEESDKFYRSLPHLLKLLFALYNTMVSQSDMLCYFVMILNHMVSASVLTMVLPILVFLWAMLSVPRPKKRFWMLAILYTE